MAVAAPVQDLPAPHLPLLSQSQSHHLLTRIPHLPTRSLRNHVAVETAALVAVRRRAVGGSLGRRVPGVRVRVQAGCTALRGLRSNTGQGS